MGRRGTDGEGDEAGAEAVAAVVCDLTSDGAFLTNAIPAGAGEVVKVRLDVCLRARVALLAAFVRSILERQWEKWAEWRGEEEELDRREASNGFAQLWMCVVQWQSEQSMFTLFNVLLCYSVERE